MFGLNVHLQYILFLVDDHILGVTFCDVLLEFRISSFLIGACVAQGVTTSGHEKYGQCNSNNCVNPVHIELRHLGLVVVVIVVGIVFIVHKDEFCYNRIGISNAMPI